MNCKEIQNILIETPDSLSAELQAHLKECTECRRFAEFQDTLLELPAVAPPAELDQTVRDAAAFRLGKRLHALHQRYRWIAAAAALFVLVGWLTFIGLPEHRETEHNIASVTDHHAKESVWADGKLEAALKGLQEQTALLNQPLPSTVEQDTDLPTLDELDDDLLDFELKFYFERAVLGTVEPQANS